MKLLIVTNYDNSELTTKLLQEMVKGAYQDRHWVKHTLITPPGLKRAVEVRMIDGEEWTKSKWVEWEPEERELWKNDKNYHEHRTASNGWFLSHEAQEEAWFVDVELENLMAFLESLVAYSVCIRLAQPCESTSVKLVLEGYF
jgi:hypothetical protein